MIAVPKVQLRKIVHIHIFIRGCILSYVKYHTVFVSKKFIHMNECTCLKKYDVFCGHHPPHRLKVLCINIICSRSQLDYRLSFPHNNCASKYAMSPNSTNTYKRRHDKTPNFSLRYPFHSSILTYAMPMTHYQRYSIV